ncbi:integrase arm-type DNA-binding domain-containing protein [Hydrogenophaga sp.]|uniref:tyrosine-type recombinase/integrase n=1 Tax=Hydrogenophaga sp. TaxID=1904254 RepID=UPI0025C67BB0|nr:integrase arm-type DNA-binding domain-containing protein [Hydrogenophaga sp.]MBT9462527.1 integrase arm-type DNA-binding domain-containing protein [Hydrogenophaga sp.]
MALTDTFVRQVKHSGRPAGDKHTDGAGMYLLVKAAGRYWRQDYAFSGKRKTLALGVYPDVSLAKARQRRDKARELLADGVDPGVAKRAGKLATSVAAANTFQAAAREFHANQAGGWSPRYAARWIERMEKDLFPYVGRLTLTEISAPILLDALRKVEKRGANETAHTLRQTAGQVFRYGIQTGRCERNPVADLHGALKPIVVKHMSAVLEPQQAGELLRAIDGYTGQPATRAALTLSALLFQRPGNIRQMEWAWIDFDKAMLTIPSAEMKRRLAQKLNGRPHLVPLSPQALATLKELQPLTGHGRFVFPSLRTGERPMSENTVNAALRRLGFTGDEMTAHGFRAMARTLLIERIAGISPEVIEAQLAHGKSGPLGMAYDRAEFMEQRRQMMDVWADYLDRLRVGAKIIPLRAA